MSEQTSQPTPESTRLPILKMAGLSVLACVMIGIGGGAIATLRDGSMTDGLLTIAAMFPGVLITLMGLNMLPTRPAGMWGVPVLGGTMFRAGIVGVIGFGVYLALEPAREIFVLTLLVSLLVVLAIDVLTVLALVKSVEIVNSEDASMMSMTPEGQV